MAIYCRSCGNAVADNARFCSVCGTESVNPGAFNAGAASYVRPPARPLVRPRAGRMIGGVCMGLANQYAWDVAWIRVIAVIAAVFGGGLGAVAYVVLWIVTPEEPLSLPPGQSFTASN
jgi:phage shock protein C